MTTAQIESINQAYAAFNRRDIPGVLVHMQPDVMWANGWEGGHVQGHEVVKDYWTRQWGELDPMVEPVGFTEREDGRIDVAVHQVVKDKNSNLLFDGTVHHIYTFEEDKIRRMDIEKEEI